MGAEDRRIGPVRRSEALQGHGKRSRCLGIRRTAAYVADAVSAGKPLQAAHRRTPFVKTGQGEAEPRRFPPGNRHEAGPIAGNALAIRTADGSAVQQASCWTSSVGGPQSKEYDGLLRRTSNCSPRSSVERWVWRSLIKSRGLTFARHCELGASQSKTWEYLCSSSKCPSRIFSGFHWRADKVSGMSGIFSNSGPADSRRNGDK